MQLLHLAAHLDPQGGIEIGERLVEQEDLRLAHDGAADGDALLLAAGKLRRVAVEQMAEVERRRPPLSTRLSISAAAMPRSFRVKPMFWATVICG